MADNKEIRGPQDRSKVNVHEDYEVRYWCEKFGCTREQLEKAVKSMGTSAQHVEEFLRN